MPGGLEAPSREAEEEANKASSRKVVFVLEQADLEVAKVGKVSFVWFSARLTLINNRQNVENIELFMCPPSKCIVN